MSIKTAFFDVKVKGDPYRVPKRIQDIIPADRIYADGCFEFLEPKSSKHSVAFSLKDVNYVTAAAEVQDEILGHFMSALNVLDSDQVAQICIFNAPLDRSQNDGAYIPEKQDKYQQLRDEFNQILHDKINERYRRQEKYLVLSQRGSSKEDAEMRMARVADRVRKSLHLFGSNLERLNAEERISSLHQWYRPEEPICYYDYVQSFRSGNRFHNYIAPADIATDKGSYRTPSRYGRVFYLNHMPKKLRDNLIRDISNMDCELALTINIVPWETSDAVDLAEGKFMSSSLKVERYLDNLQKKGVYLAKPTRRMKLEQEATEKFLDTITSQSMRMFQVAILIAIQAETEEELELRSVELKKIVAEHSCTADILYWQQLRALNSVLPYGLNQVKVRRALTTKSLAICVPFNSVDFNHGKGVYYGLNQITHNPIIMDRNRIRNSLSLTVGSSGSGKSFAAKREILNVFLGTEADIIILDPEHEYTNLVQAIDGEIVEISAQSSNHVNALDIQAETGADLVRAVQEKQGYVVAILEQGLKESLSSEEKAIIGRVLRRIYRPYINSGGKRPCPTLRDLYEALKREPEALVERLAVRLEDFVDGHLSLFSHPTNIDIENRVLCFDLNKLSHDFKDLGLTVMLDMVLNRVIQNFKKGRQTYLFIDELHLLLQTPYAAQFVSTLWRRLRKYWCFPTGITQNLSDFVHSEEGATMIKNSEVVFIYKVNGDDLVAMTELFGFSEEQLVYVRNSKIGSGLAKLGDTIIPFEDDFPRSSKLYRLITTKPGEFLDTE